MKTVALLFSSLFFTLQLATCSSIEIQHRSSASFPVRNEPQKLSTLRRSKRGSVVVPTITQDEHGTMIEITFEPRPTEENESGLSTKRTNLNPNSAFGESGDVNRRGMGRHGNGINPNNIAMVRQLSRDSTQTNKKNPLSILGAAFNVLNPIPYVKGSLKGFHNVFKGNIRPFLQSPNKPYASSMTDVNLVSNQHSQLSINNDASSPPEDSSTTSSNTHSSLLTKNGLNLQIPPELVSYSALEVNLKPNGEINIAPAGVNATKNRNPGGGTPDLLLTQTFSGEGSDTSKFNDVSPTPADSVSSASNSFNYGPLESLNKVKLVTDKPMVVSSIQDIINLQNLVEINRNKNRPIHFDALLKHNPIPIDLSSLYERQRNNIAKNDQSPFPSEHIYLLPFRVNDDENPTSLPPLPPRNSNRNKPPPHFNEPHPPPSAIPPPPPSPHQRHHPRHPPPFTPPGFYPRISDSEVGPSEIYYIDITIPDGDSAKPIVQHQRISSKKKRRNKRSALASEDKKQTSNIKRDRKLFIDYDGWQPMGVSNPMLNKPTLVYKPPTLQRVQFYNSPTENKPLYPVRPVNPPVYVATANPSSKQVHSIYGTEQINYLHINPDANEAKVFSNFKRSPSSEQAKNSPNKSRRRSPKVKIKVKELRPVKARESENSEIHSKENSPNLVISVEATTLSAPTTTTTTITTTSSSKPKTKKSAGLSFEEILKSSLSKTKPQKPELVIDIPQEVSENDYPLNSDFSEKIISDDGDYYIYYDYDEYEEPQSDGDLAFSASDPFASIIPFIPREDRIESSIEAPDKLKTSSSNRNVQKVNLKKASLYELLRGFEGAQFDPYIGSASDVEEKSLDAKDVRENRFYKYQNRKFSLEDDEEEIPTSTYTRPWYLIETRPKQKERNHIEKRPYPGSKHKFFTNRHVSKFSESKYIYNPYLEDHLNSFKPTESLMANSLSELLQIFKYITTPNPLAKQLEVKPKSFRYTKPTEAPDQFTSEKPRRFTTFRYTLSPSKTQTSTDPTVYDVGTIDAPIINLNDSVAETNSLDGYLFSDSEASPEYIRPETHPNSIHLTPREKAIVRFERITQDPPKMDKDAVRRSERDPFVVVELAPTTDSSSYLVHEGHSKVKIFGSYNRNKSLKISSQKQNKHIDPIAKMSKQYEHLITYPPGIVVSPVTAKPLAKIPGFVKTSFIITTSTERSIKPVTENAPNIVTKYFVTTTVKSEEVSKINKKSSQLVPTKVTDSSIESLPKHVENQDNLIKERKENEANDRLFIDVGEIDSNREDDYNPINSFKSSESAEKLSSTTDEIIDLNSLPSPLQAFSRLFFSYFPTPKKVTDIGRETKKIAENLERLKNAER